MRRQNPLPGFPLRLSPLTIDEARLIQRAIVAVGRTIGFDRASFIIGQSTFNALRWIEYLVGCESKKRVEAEKILALYLATPVLFWLWLLARVRLFGAGLGWPAWARWRKKKRVGWLI